MTKKDVILTHLITDVGVVAARVLAALIDEYPQRSYYGMWMLPRHNDIMKRMKLSSHQYYNILHELEARHLLKKQQDKKIKKLVYQVGYDILEAYDPSVTLTI